MSSSTGTAATPKSARRTGPDLPWTALSLAAAAILCGGVLAVWDLPTLVRTWTEASGAGWLPRLLVSLGLLLAAVLLATASGFALATVLRACPAWLRSIAAVVCKAAALFPFAALVWVFVGFWLGRQGWPVESLMPAPAEIAGAAGVIWKWLLPVLLVAAPLTAELAAHLLGRTHLRAAPALTGRGLNRTRVFYQHELPRWWRQSGGKIQRLGLLGAGCQLFIEHALDLPGACSFLARVLHRGEAGATLAAFTGWLFFAACGCLLIWALHRAFARMPEEQRHDPAAALIEGAVVIGMSRAAAWRRHVLPRQARALLSCLLEAASWAVVWTILISAVIGRGPGAALGAAGIIAFEDYRAPLAVAMAPALWALSLWLLSRMVAPRPYPQTHGRNPT